MYKMPLIAVLLSLLAACGSSDKPAADSAATPPPNAATIHVSKSNAFSPLVQDLNKAKQVNSQVQQQAQQTDQQIESDSAPAAATSNDP